jgi:hypothetical protein
MEDHQAPSSDASEEGPSRGLTGSIHPISSATAGALPEPPRPWTIRWFRTPAGLTLLAILAFVVIGGYDRLHDLGGVSLWDDEAQSTLYAFSVLKHGYPIITAKHVIDNWEPLYPYIEALSILTLGPSNFAFRIPSVLLGIALIPLAYWIGARVRDRYVGIALAAMVALSSEYIAWSRQARWYMLMVILMALGFLVALVWYHARSRRERTACLIGGCALGVLAGLAGIGVFLLYLPGILVAGLVYYVVSRWESFRRWFGRPSPPVTPSELPPARILPYRYRPWVVLAAIGAVSAGVAILRRPLGAVYTAVFTRLVGFPPYPLAWSGVFGPYLLQYYPGIIALAVVGAGFIFVRRDPLETALVAFCAAGFVGVSLFASLTNGPTVINAATQIGQRAAYERHIVPLLFFLFLVAALGIVELFRRLLPLLAARLHYRPRVRGVAPALFGVAVVVLLVLPGIVVPSQVTVYRHVASSPADNLVAWFPFSLDPVYPSALYLTEQANYQLAADYVLAHRNASDVVATTAPSPTVIYCGEAQYWVDSRSIPAQIVFVNGRPTFFQTGSILVANTSEMEGLLFNSSGWLVSDVPYPSPIPFPNGMNYVITKFMTKISVASDVSISLYHWNISTVLTLLEMLAARTAWLVTLESNVTLLVNWAATAGVTSSPFRDLLLPMEYSFLPYVSSGLLPLAILINLYNHRPDLQAAFPQVLNQPSNDTALIQWAYQVATGAIADPAEPILAPYATWYYNHG